MPSFKDVVPPPRPEGKVVVVMPAYNAAQTLQATYGDIDHELVDEVILVDDCSTDGTADLAESLGITTIRHTTNTGYGGNQKSLYTAALERGADIVVMIHPDYQYDARLIPSMVQIMRLRICDVVLGSRIRTRAEALQCGMPGWKYLANRFLTFTENLVLGQNVGDFHTGMRAYTREVLETIPFERNSDDFVFDTQFLVQAVWFDFKISDIPVPCRYFEEASSINFKRSARYGLGTLGMLGRFALGKLGMKSGLFEAKAAASAG